MSQTPTIGRIIHVRLYPNSPEHVPAIVTYVHPPGAHRSDPAKDGTLLNIGLWDPMGGPSPGIQGIPEDQTAQRPMSWHWPEVTAAPAPKGFTEDQKQQILALIESKLASSQPKK